MANFDKQIKNFVAYGTYNYIFDEVGNEILNPSSSVFQNVYFCLPVKGYIYNDSKVLSFHDPTFVEFVATQVTSSVSGSTPTLPQEAIDQINKITAENLLLQDQLNSVVAASEFDSTSAEMQSVKDIILELRVKLGQGTSSDDFSDQFPYMPISLENK